MSSEDENRRDDLSHYHQVWEWRLDDSEPYWLVRLAEMPQVVGDGATRAEAEDALRACFDDFIAYRRTEGLGFPGPGGESATG